MYYIELAGTCVSELTVMNEVTINHQNSTVVLSSKYRAKTLYDSWWRIPVHVNSTSRGTVRGGQDDDSHIYNNLPPYSVRHYS